MQRSFIVTALESSSSRKIYVLNVKKMMLTKMTTLWIQCCKGLKLRVSFICNLALNYTSKLVCNKYKCLLKGHGICFTCEIIHCVSCRVNTGEQNECRTHWISTYIIASKFESASAMLHVSCAVHHPDCY